MKKSIGILGGTNYLSTILYYQYLNENYQARFGGSHSCPLHIHSIDYHDIKTRYSSPSGWEQIPELLNHEIEILLRSQPSCIIIANNTLHKAFDLLGDKIKLPVPLLHAVTLAKQEALACNYKKILLMGTRFTMEDDYFKVPLASSGIEVMVPNQLERDEIHAIHAELASGKHTNAHIEFFSELSSRYSHLDAFIIACTELPLILNHIKLEVPIIDSMKLQCEKALQIFDYKTAPNP
ncbi:MAG: amino acid racemase [Pedobacter sp.]|nr:MAG: amino acid racemase [Pedobacter sp.]